MPWSLCCGMPEPVDVEQYTNGMPAGYNQGVGQGSLFLAWLSFLPRPEDRKHRLPRAVVPTSPMPFLVELLTGPFVTCCS